MAYKVKISKGGKISIPSACRKYLNVKDGEELLFNLNEGQVVISSTKFLLEKVRKNLNRYFSPKESLVDQLIEQRKREAENE